MLGYWILNWNSLRIEFICCFFSFCFFDRRRFGWQFFVFIAGNVQQHRGAHSGGGCVLSPGRNHHKKRALWAEKRLDQLEWLRLGHLQYGQRRESESLAESRQRLRLRRHTHPAVQWWGEPRLTSEHRVKGRQRITQPGHRHLAIGENSNLNGIFLVIFCWEKKTNLLSFGCPSWVPAKMVICCWRMKKRGPSRRRDTRSPRDFH